MFFKCHENIYPKTAYSIYPTNIYPNLTYTFHGPLKF